MTIYKVLVVDEDQNFVYESGLFADFHSAHLDFVSQLLETAVEDTTVEAGEIDQVVSQAEQLSMESLENGQFIQMFGQYAHCIVEVQ
jgi:hypothetical protein